jgi:threonine dehydrogenase-like Zn-dependent dehydrogenase
MVMEGGIDINPLITGTYKISNVLDAMKAFDADQDHVKVTLEP